MPYMLQGQGKETCVHKKNADDTPGEKMKCFMDEQEAKDYMAALYANEGGATKGWITVNGAHILVGDDDGGSGGGSGGDSGGSGSSGGGSGWKSPREEFRFVQRRLGVGNLKRGERRMLERRSERLAKQVLGVDD